MPAWIRPGKPALLLAPMEGVTDGPMRTLLTERPGFTHCVTEFLRISQIALPNRCYPAHAHELKSGSLTPTGVPVIFQLLGGHAERLALSAARAAEMGAAGIDLNFGCPAPTVNSHDGGAAILRNPCRVEEIVRAVREAVPPHIPVSAKIRLGWENPEDVFENAERAVKGGAAWITIHGRTKMQGYAPPANWGLIGEVIRRLPKTVPVIANGDIFTFEDFLRCREQTGAEHFMIGRGALANPLLPQQVAREMGLVRGEAPKPLNNEEWRALLQRFLEVTDSFAGGPTYGLTRVKQWLRFVSSRTPFAGFDEVKRLQTLDELRALLPRLTFPEPSA